MGKTGSISLILGTKGQFAKTPGLSEKIRKSPNLLGKVPFLFVIEDSNIGLYISHHPKPHICWRGRNPKTQFLDSLEMQLKYCQSRTQQILCCCNDTLYIYNKAILYRSIDIRHTVYVCRDTYQFLNFCVLKGYGFNTFTQYTCIVSYIQI